MKPGEPYRHWQVTSTLPGLYPPEVFDLMTDILADLVLEDMKQFPKIAAGQRIDSFSRQENTTLHTQEGGE